MAVPTTGPTQGIGTGIGTVWNTNTTVGTSVGQSTLPPTAAQWSAWYQRALQQAQGSVQKALLTTPPPEAATESFAQWTRMIRVQRKRRIVLGVSWGIIALGFLTVIISAMVATWMTKDLSLFAKVVITGVTTLILGIICIITAVDTKPWEWEWPK